MIMQQLDLGGSLIEQELASDIHIDRRGTHKRTINYLKREVARLVAQGQNTTEISKILGVKKARVRVLLNEVEKNGLVDDLMQGRDDYTKNMVDKMRDIAEEASDIIAERLVEINDEESLDARAMKDAFSSFDRAATVTGIDGSSKSKSGDKTVNIAIFSDDALTAAKEASGRIFDIENK